jgi:hypothetical protein
MSAAKRSIAFVLFAQLELRKRADECSGLRQKLV